MKPFTFIDQNGLLHTMYAKTEKQAIAGIKSVDYSVETLRRVNK